MLTRHDPVDVAALVEMAVERQAAAGIKAIFAAAMAHLAGHAIPEAELLAQYRLGVLAGGAAQALGLGTDLNTGTRNRPDVLAAVALDLHQKLRLDQCCHHCLQRFFLLLRIKRRAGFKGALQPVLRPCGSIALTH